MCNMFHLTYEWFDEYDSYSLDGYQFVSQEILYLTFLVHTLLYNKFSYTVRCICHFKHYCISFIQI